MAKIACCYNCAYSYLDREHTLSCLSTGILTWPACANHPESCGRMERAPERGICPNYRPRAATPEGDVRQISVGGGSYAYVDAADFDWLNQWTWRLRGGYAMRHSKGKPIYMHREIMQPPKGMVVDHKNRNKLDDTRANLRICTHRENAYNKDKRQGTSSRFRGVSRRKGTDRWYAAIRVQGKPIFLGSFTEEIEAARAYDRAAVAYFGESAALNFPEEWPPQRRQEVRARREEVAKEGKTRDTQRRTHGARRKTRAAGRRATRGGDDQVKGKGRKAKRGGRTHPAGRTCL